MWTSEALKLRSVSAESNDRKLANDAREITAEPKKDHSLSALVQSGMGMATEAIFCGSKSFWPFENSQNVEARYDEASVRVGDIGASSHDHGRSVQISPRRFIILQGDK